LLLLPAAAAAGCRPDYMTTFVDKLINWDAVAKRYEAATA
jgi:superoxide dismutase